jgi:predicted esterase
MPRVLSRSLPAQVHGRYLVESPDGEGPYPLIVGFHGYGETAERHLAALRELKGAGGYVLVAVQSLHLFYTKAGEVVGSWMTKLGREEAIADNIRYVAEVVARARGEIPWNGKLAYVGFSQGAAMAYRAAARAGHECHALAVLGGDMPPDVADDPSVRLPPVLVARGERDEWFTQEKLDRDVASLAARGALERSLVFDGGHEWTPAFSSEAGEFLARVVPSR